VDLNLDQLGQLAAEVFNVDARAAIDVRRIFGVKSAAFMKASSSRKTCDSPARRRNCRRKMKTDIPLPDSGIILASMGLGFVLIFLEL